MTTDRITLRVCPFEWFGPYEKPDGSVIHVRQACVLNKGHDGQHRSRDKVTHANVKDWVAGWKP